MHFRAAGTTKSPPPACARRGSIRCLLRHARSATSPARRSSSVEAAPVIGRVPVDRIARDHARVWAIRRRNHQLGDCVVCRLPNRCPRIPAPSRDALAIPSGSIRNASWSAPCGAPSAELMNSVRASGRPSDSLSIELCTPSPCPEAKRAHGPLTVAMQQGPPTPSRRGVGRCARAAWPRLQLHGSARAGAGGRSGLRTSACDAVKPWPRPASTQRVRDYCHRRP